MEKGKIELVKTLKISDNMHASLTQLGSKAETYEDIIARIIVHYTTCNVARREQKPLTAKDWANK